MTNTPETKSFSGRFSNLPSPPAILIELIDSCNNPDVSIAKLADIIRKDASVSSKVISAANSPFYRQWQEISDLHRLLVVLGMKSVRTIAINSAVQQFFGQLGKQMGRTVDRIWYHSLVCAYCARSLAELTTYTAPEEAYFAGLLHRLGQLALLQAYPEVYQKILDQNLTGSALSQAEKEDTGYTSPAVAAQLIDSWELRSFLSDAVLYQYEPAETVLDGSHLVKLINLASHLSHFETTPDNETLERADLLFGLNQSMVEKLLNESQEKAKTTARSLGIALPSEKSDPQAQSHQQALGERVKQAALFGGGIDSSPEKNDLPMTLQQIQHDLDLLFGFKQTCFLLFDSDEKKLQPIDPILADDKLLEGIVFSTESERSLASKAFISQEICHSFEASADEPLPVGDRQLARYVRSDDLLYLPLTSEQQRMGLIAIGLTESLWHALEEQQSLLQLFAKEAAQTLIRQQEMAQSQQQVIDEERAAFHLEARKVVHEANNPLGIINNYLHILGMKLGEDHEAQGEIDIIKEEIDRVGKIILRMRDIPEGLEKQERTVDINQLITDLDKLFQSSLFPSHNISSTLDLDRNIPAIHTQRSHMKQILTNLVKNAAEAMDQGGNLNIVTRDNAYLNGKAFIEIQIIDDGPGIPADIMQQLFTPVTSTKDSSHSGLGLAIVKNLIDELSGHISCTSNQGQGTRFQLYLPRTGISTT
ncbi:MAG: HDOD domain-containing protein [Candidatus Thiodiazotropha sp. (ex Myrtea sp. 'scaly one' KF741663)]|nr:HDOD domain-containing protein [Candidatus Thiodiazotropha sp. (ex Myrtea sp. 'scaly one' KF741663)]